MTKINKYNTTDGLASCNISPSSVSNSPDLTNNSASNQDQYQGQEYDLRPKFAILKHKPDIINQTLPSAKNLNHQQRLEQQQQYKQQHSAPTPAWFFNIPTTKSPFPYFESKLPNE